MLDGHRLHLSQAADLQPADKKGNEQWAVEDSVQSFHTPKEAVKKEKEQVEPSKHMTWKYKNKSSEEEIPV